MISKFLCTFALFLLSNLVEGANINIAAKPNVDIAPVSKLLSFFILSVTLLIKLHIFGLINGSI